MAKRAVIQINTELLGKLLQLPEGLEIVHVAAGNHGMAIDLVVTAPDMFDLEPNMQPPRLWPLVALDGNGVRIVEVDYPREAGADPTAMTEVPPEFFDELTASLEEPPERNERVPQATRRLGAVVDRRGDKGDPA